MAQSKPQSNEKSKRGGSRSGAGRKPKSISQAAVEIPQARGGRAVVLAVEFDGDRQRSASYAFAVMDAMVRSDDIDPELRLRAARAILDRVEGRPRQMVVVATTEDPDITEYELHERPPVVVDADADPTEQASA